MGRARGELPDEVRALLEAGAGGGGPPFVLGQRGSPLEAPENTLPALARALELGLDGLCVDVRATRDRALVLLADETLERTTSGSGRVGERRLVEIARLDAGASFAARFAGTGVPLLEDALRLRGPRESAPARRWVLVHERGLAGELAESVRAAGQPLELCVLSAIHDVCLEAREAGLDALLVAEQAGEKEALFVREEGLAGCALPLAAWRALDPARGFPGRRVTLGLDGPAELLEACRLPLDAFGTHEPLRALAVRAVARLAPADRGPYPIELEPLALDAAAEPGARGGAFGRWESAARVRNPFPFAVRATVGILPRHGAFDVGGLPQALALAPGEARRVEFTLAGGSWRLGADPCFFALYRWPRARGRAAGPLLLDAPLARVRRAVADAVATRLVLLCESPGDGPATMLVRREGRYLLVSLESGVAARDARTVVHLDGRLHFGARGVRVPLPEDFDRRREGVSFSCGVVVMADGERRVRRWAGGVPDAFGCGSPGVLHAHGRA